MTIRLAALSAVFLLAFTACTRETQQPAAPPAQPAAQPAVAKAAAVPATPAPATATAAARPNEALLEAYRTALADLRKYQGDPRVLDKARAAFTELVARDRNFAPAYAGLAWTEYYVAYVNNGYSRPEPLRNAWKFASHALKLDPECYDAHVASAYVSMARGDYDLAREALHRAEEIDPSSVRHVLGRAHLAEKEEDIREAVRLAREVVAKGKDPADLRQARRVLITALEGLGHLDEADAEYRATIALDPHGAWTHGNYAGFLLDRNDIDGAIREAEAAVAITPYPIAVDTLARALLQRAHREWNANQIAQAGRTLERVAKLSEGHPSMYVALGSFYETAAVRAKDPAMNARALEWYEKALALMPDNRDLQKVVERLKDKKVG